MARLYAERSARFHPLVKTPSFSPSLSYNSSCKGNTGLVNGFPYSSGKMTELAYTISLTPASQYCSVKKNCLLGRAPALPNKPSKTLGNAYLNPTYLPL
ncbi:hypothetical protein [Coleofasciculus sp. G2-EDA-02]|uniref:hypothetical protein n=1 Tax=Coleofasciculus sp. G2-EDA-02 TaxID=3069529 RepID=UPI003304D59B